MSWRRAAIIVSSLPSSGLPRQIIGPDDKITTATAGVPGTIINFRNFAGGNRRNGQGADGYVEENLGDFPGIHDLLDPTTAKRSRGFEIRDWIVNSIAIGACSFGWGLHDLVVANDWTTLVGLGFEHGPDFQWKTFLKDAPAGVPRVVHQTVLASFGNVPHELMIVVDGFLKQVRWFVDSIQVDSYTPSIPLDQMGGTVAAMSLRMRYRGLVPAGGDMQTKFYGGELAAPLLTLREFP
jgi:hypothetical protein